MLPGAKDFWDGRQRKNGYQGFCLPPHWRRDRAKVPSEKRDTCRDGVGA